MRVLVTGSSGFLGSSLVGSLESLGIPVERVLRVGELPSGAIKQPYGWDVLWPSGLAEIDYSGYTHIVHLANGPSGGATIDGGSGQLASHIDPVKSMIAGLSSLTSPPRLIFLSSQSAWQGSTSHYGRGKFQVEQLLKTSRQPCTIIRPGLVVDADAGGLFGVLLRAIRIFPVVPVPSSSRIAVQIISRRDVIETLVSVITLSSGVPAEFIELGLPRQSLFSFVRQMRDLVAPKTFIMGIPLWSFRLAVWTMGTIIKSSPFSTAQLDDLMNCPEIKNDYVNTALGREPFSLTAILENNLEGADSLHREAVVLFKSLFGTTPSQSIILQYKEAHSRLGLPMESSDMDAIVDQKLDCEALELALRGRGHVLSKKMVLLCYLAELERRHFSAFVNSRQNWVLGCAVLVYHVGRTALKKVAGCLALRRLPVKEV